MSQPISIHPENPKLFQFRGKPLALLTATEHYGAVMNRPFRFEHYLADMAQRGITITRLFTLFRELQSAANPYSTCKPESPDYIAPFQRVGPGTALDMQPKYDLQRPNPEFFDRLSRFLSMASDYGIIVELVLFSNTYSPTVWGLNPLNAANNINDVETIPWYDYNTLRNPKLLACQEAHARQIVEAVNQYDNMIIEICNEPGGGTGIPGSATPEDVNAWLESMIRLAREIEAKLPNQHLIAGQEAFAYKLPDEDHNPLDVHQFADRSFRDVDYDVVNMHPLSNMKYGGKHYNMGGFMRGQLCLRPLRDYCLDTYGEAKPLNMDEDNAAAQYKDLFGWTIHRKRAWTTLMCGGHYDMIDFSIINYCETGTDESRRHLRSWMGHLSWFIHSFDLSRARPLQRLVTAQPQHTCESVFGVAGQDFAVYLADEREAEEPDCGKPISGSLELQLPAGEYMVSCFDPVTGVSSPAISVQSDGRLRFTLPEFEHDMVVRVAACNDE